MLQQEVFANRLKMRRFSLYYCIIQPAMDHYSNTSSDLLKHKKRLAPSLTVFFQSPILKGRVTNHGALYSATLIIIAMFISTRTFLN